MDKQPVSASGKPGLSAPQPAALRQFFACDANPQFLSGDEGAGPAPAYASPLLADRARSLKGVVPEKRNQRS
jgi:hypothetical protein